MKKNLYLTLLLSFFSLSTYAQTDIAKKEYNPNHMLWLNTQINGKIKGKFSYACDLEMRRQADPYHAPDPGDKVGSDHWNIIKHPYQDAVRPWIHYQLNETVRFSWSPVTWFGTWSFPINGKTTYQPELRTSPQITLYQKWGKLQIQQRYRFEFRFYGKKVADTHPGNVAGPGGSYDFTDAGTQNRFRYMLRLIYPLNGKTLEKGTYYIMTSSEVFLSQGKNIPNNKIFDQNRFYFVLGYKFHPDIRLEVGYLNQTAFRMNNKAKDNVDVNNCLAVTFIFDNLNNLFKKSIPVGN